MSDTLSAWSASPRIVDVVLVLVVIEAVGLAALHRLTGRGPSLRSVWGGLLSGAFLLLAVRAALAGAAWPWIPACLIGSLLAHLADLASRWNATDYSPARPRGGTATDRL
ncbi:hypothetical protein A33M_1590 [Rhodovulum sp. PH10]|uniref:hypothetical protein n=1 Tax=Rhodovulum sp. PH10 TaxID=1187851 RepID=UPI00027C2192|nr:hypothetical protein [Rhodovulum sp. PH10]EJW12801.1 hypothetical protein A33M_1590 [Rhodovulum sp. PH10]